MKLSIHVAGIFALAAIATSGCALTSKADALTIRWYTPENAKATLTSSGSTTGEIRDGSAQIQLGRVNSGINLREKIAYRDSTYEQGFYEDRRWTERPDVYVRRELERTLFEEHGFRRALAAQAPALEVEVVNFEEVLGPGNVHNTRIQLKIVLHDEKDSLLERTVTVERPVAGKDFPAVVQAMALTLDAAAEETTADVERIVKSRPASAAH